MTPAKVGFLRPNKVLGAPKSFLRPHKTQKIDFLKKLELYDLAARNWIHSRDKRTVNTSFLTTKNKNIAVRDCILAMIYLRTHLSNHNFMSYLYGICHLKLD